MEPLPAHEEVRGLVKSRLLGREDRVVVGAESNRGVRQDSALNEIVPCRAAGLGRPSGRGEAVSVREGKNGRLRLGGPEVSRRAGAKTPLPKHSHPRAAGDRCGVVSGAVIDDDHLEAVFQILLGQRREGSRDGRARIARRDDDAHGRHERN